MDITNRVSEDTWDVLKHNRNHEKLLIVLEYDPETNTEGRRERWTDLSENTLRLMGYKRAYGFKDKLAFTGVSVYVKMVGFRQAMPPDHETAESLRQFLESRASEGFKKGFAKTGMDPLQMKQIIAVLPIVIGIALGLFLFFGGGF